MSGDAVTLTGLTKRYGDVTAVDDVSLRVAPGEIYALLGLNGAGKTTLIRAPARHGAPDGRAGERCSASRSAGAPGRCGPGSAISSRPRRRTQSSRCGRTCSCRRACTASTGGGPRSTTSSRRSRLTPYADRRARTLSLGNAQRLGLAKALLHRPELLVLDEPSNGLDPAGVVEIRELIRDLGVTVLLSSHVLAEVARLATRIGIIHHGRLPRELDATSRLRRRLSVSTRDLPAATAVLRRAGYEPRPDDGRAGAGRGPGGRRTRRRRRPPGRGRPPAHPACGRRRRPRNLLPAHGRRQAMREALATEAVKLRRSRLPWITVIGFTLATIVSGLFTFIAQNPDRARSLGLAGAKAQMAGVTADWPVLPGPARPGRRRRRIPGLRDDGHLGLRTRVQRPHASRTSSPCPPRGSPSSPRSSPSPPPGAARSPSTPACSDSPSAPRCACPAGRPA